MERVTGFDVPDPSGDLLEWLVAAGDLCNDLEPGSTDHAERTAQAVGYVHGPSVGADPGSVRP